MDKDQRFNPVLEYGLWIGPLAIFVAIADFVVKRWVIENIEAYSVVPVIEGYFNLTRTMNHGIAFGLLSELGQQYRSVAVVFLTSLALSVVFYILTKLNYRGRIAQFAFGLILGGAFGNILDRIQFGAVVDYLDFYYDTYHWPAFNLADSCICIGVGLLIMYKPEAPEKQPDTLKQRLSEFGKRR